MTGVVRTVFQKEALENLRDRRVLLSAFLIGSFLPPLLFSLLMGLFPQRALESADRPLKLAVAGSAHAPSLLQFLEENGAQTLELQLTPEQAVSEVRARRHELILLIGERYAARLQAGEPAPLELVADTSDAEISAAADRAHRLLRAYGRQLATLRLLARGISPEVIEPLEVRVLDVATPASRSLLLLGMMNYLLLLSVIMGGFYLAIDTTAGERERSSLEPLLTLPVSRGALVAGKMLATAAFMIVSLLISLATFAVALSFVPLEAIGMSANLGPRALLAIFGAMATFVPLGAPLMTLVASFTRSAREAQTWLTPVVMVPAGAVGFAAVNGTKASAALMAVPALSQHLLASGVLRGDAIPFTHVAICLVSTLGLGALLAWLAIRFYHREAILG